MAYFDQAPYVRHVEKSTHTILGSNDAPTSAEWHSENEASQAETSALAATGEVEDAPVAGVRTRPKDQGMHTNFVWDGPYPYEESSDVVRQSSGASEYRASFVNHPTSEVPFMAL